jgi:hypothetical protein
MKEAITTLREKMYDCYLVENVSGPIIEVWRIYQDLFLRCYIGKPVIFTTNYDTVFEALDDRSNMEFDLINGVRPKKQRRVFELANYLKENTDNPLYLFKMHGSVTWERKDGAVFDHYPVRQKISDMPTLRRPLGIVEPVLSKSEFVPPFSHLYTIFERMLQNAKACVCIGFSFRDTNLYELVDKTLKKRKGLKLVCVSPDEPGDVPKEILDVNENIRKLEADHKNNVVWVKNRFEEEPVIPRILDELQPDFRGS